METFSTCCRLCLSSQETNLPLFGLECQKDLIPEKILYVLSILVHPQDTLPQRICSTCVDQVRKLYKFHRTASRSLEHLLTFFEKDDDVDKNLYSKCQKNIRNKNYSYLLGNSNYDIQLQEKYNQVKASVDDLTSRLPHVPDPVPEVNFGLLNNITPTVVHITNDVSPKIRCQTKNEQVVKKNTGRRSKKPSISNESELTTGSNTKITLFRCKHCSCVYPNQKDLLNHDVDEHGVMVNVQKYYGPSELELGQDIESQIKKLTWPNRKQRYSNVRRGRKKVIENENVPLLAPVDSTEDVKIKLGKNKVTSPNENIKVHHESIRRKRCLENCLDSIEVEEPAKIIKIGPKSRKLMLAKVREDYERTQITVHNTKGKSPKLIKNSSKLKSSPLKRKYVDNQCKYCELPLESHTPKEFLSHIKGKQCNSFNGVRCSLCLKDFSSRKEHLKEHEKNCKMTDFFTQELICFQCSGFMDKKYLLDHLVDTHTTLFKCFVCSSQFNQKERLLDHFLNCSFRPVISTTSFPCVTCKLEFGTLTSLKKHTLEFHTSHNLNMDLSLDYSNLNQLVEKKSQSNILQYQKTNFINCNSTGKFHCKIRPCSKVFNTIFDFETHLQNHCRKGTKRGGSGKDRVKIKSNKAEGKNQFKNGNRLPVCTNYFLRKSFVTPDNPTLLSSESVFMEPKEKFLFTLGLVKCQQNDINIDDLMTDDRSYQSPRGIFELSEKSNELYITSQSIDSEKKSSPEVLTVESDDDRN